MTNQMQQPTSAAPLAVILPWPPSGLSPNARHAHWSQLATLKRRYRAACANSARAQGAARIEADRLQVALTFVPPDRRHRDADNCLASMKSGLDGLADVLGVDDSRWRVGFEVAEGVGGFVRVEVAPC
jgi:crossover junction endodeoxyribonuclease RusA